MPRFPAGLRRRPASLRARLFLSHLAAVLISVAVMLVMTPLLMPAEFDPEGNRRTSLAREIEAAFNQALIVAALLGLAVAVVAAVVFSRLLLRSLDRIRAATHRMAAGRYGEPVPLPREPELSRLVVDVNRLSTALADVERRRARLVSEVAHEMRTPLTTLRGQLDGVIDGVFPPTPELFASLLDDVARLQRLAGDLSSLSRIEEGAFRLERAETDLTAVALRAAERLRPQFADPDVDLVVSAPAPVPAEVDAERLAQVVTNLLGNALAATAPGGRVEVSVTREDHQAVITVVDTGVGLAAEDLERVFHRFERVEHPGRPASASGSGIGLTIARGIVRAHGGEITAASPGPGEGATFRVTLPAVPSWRP